MAMRILLQLGQLWRPGRTGFPVRKIVALSNDSLFWTASAPEGPAYQTGYAQFRRWIRSSGAVLDGRAAEVRASPSVELAKKVVMLRKTSGLTQEALGKVLGLSRSAVAAMETGRHSSARLHIPRLAALFQVPVNFFLSGMIEQDVTMTLSIDEAALIDLYRRVTPELKINMQKYAERQTGKI